MRNDSAYLQYILESIDRVERYTNDGEAAFMADVRTQDAVLRRMEPSPTLLPICRTSGGRDNRRLPGVR
jgi:hypothetical protein